MVSAFLYAQLEHADDITARRRRICSAYAEQLAPLEQAGKLRLPHLSAGSNSHMFYVLPGSLATRTAMIAHLKKQDIHPVFHYVPLHSSPAGRNYGRVSGTMQVTDDVSQRLLRLPLHYEMDDADVARICAAIHDFF